MGTSDTSSTAESERWRAVIAALLDDDARAVLAESAPQDLTPKRRERALARLERAGVIRRADDATADGRRELDTRSLRSMLGGSRRRVGVERFLDRSGRIDRYPASPADRRELLIWVVGPAIPPGVSMTEKELGVALHPYAPREDVAGLRRALVDEGILERTRSGSAYFRADDSADRR